MTVTVKFLHGMSPFQAGEVAGFTPATASALIERGIAVEVNPEPVQAKEQKAPPVDKMETPDKPKRRTKKADKE